MNTKKLLIGGASDGLFVDYDSDIIEIPVGNNEIYFKSLEESTTDDIYKIERYRRETIKTPLKTYVFYLLVGIQLEEGIGRLFENYQGKEEKETLKEIIRKNPNKFDEQFLGAYRNNVLFHKLAIMHVENNCTYEDFLVNSLEAFIKESEYLKKELSKYAEFYGTSFKKPSGFVDVNNNE